MPFNIAALAFAHGLGDRAEHPALVIVSSAKGDGGLVRTTVSHGDLRDGALRFAAGLAEHGVQPGDRVLVRLPTSVEFAFAALGTWAAGAVLVPSSDMLTPDEAAFLARDSGARVVIGDSSLPGLPSAQHAATAHHVHALLDTPAALKIAPTQPDDPALLIYTSGTTSQPKGVLHAHRMALGRAPMRDGWTGISADDIVLHAGKLNWTYTLGMALIDAPAAGATAVLYADAATPEIWPQLVANEQATVFAAVPSVYRRILKYGGNLQESCATLSRALTAGEPLSTTIAEQWRERVGCPLYEALGMSECSTYVSSGPNTPVRPGSPGRPQPGRRIAVLPVDPSPTDSPALDATAGITPLPIGEVGLLAIHRSDPGLMLGYWNRPDEEAQVLRGEWFVGGDLARLDDDGYVWFEGRSNDLMNAFGYRVSPLEVEAEIGALPGVAAYAVAEREVSADVRVVCLYAVLRAETAASAETADALRAACAERLASYKCPRAVVFCDSLPRGRNGKLQRRALAEFTHPVF